MHPISRLLLVAGLAVVSVVSARQALATRYSNPKYGVSVVLPARADVCGPFGPNPNHGVLFRPAGVTSPPCDDDIDSGGRYTAIDAHFAPDDEPAEVSAMARKECPAFAYDSQGGVTFVLPPPLVGGLPRAACRIDGADGSITISLLVRRAASAGVPAIDYTLTLKTTHSPSTRPTIQLSCAGSRASGSRARCDDEGGPVFLIALAAAASGQARAFDPWASFSRGGITSELVEVATFDGAAAVPVQYRLRLTTHRLRGHKPVVRWADSIACPVVRAVVLGMDGLAMPTPAPIGGAHEQKIVVLDGADYSLTAPSTFILGKLTITSTDESPLADWINSAFKQLAPCWRVGTGHGSG